MPHNSPASLIYTDPRNLRMAIRASQFNGETAGQAPGYTQGNLAILPRAFAGDFLRYCQLNPKPCPLIGMSEPGDPRIPALGDDLDIRTDISRYCLWENGEYRHELADLRDEWRDDWVAFVIGCSFSLEEALIEGGIPLKHIAAGRNVAMYRTNIATARAGPFGGPLIVSMRPMTPAHAIRAIQITSRFPNVHGAPVHFGDPQDIAPDESPVFWACWVTPQSAIRSARPPGGHHPQAGLHAGHRCAQFAVGVVLNVPGR